MAGKNLLTGQALIILLRNVLFIEIAISKIFIIESCQTIQHIPLHLGPVKKKFYILGVPSPVWQAKAILLAEGYFIS